MTQFEILSKTNSRPFGLGDDPSGVIKALGQADSHVKAEGNMAPSDWLYWEDLDLRILVSKNKIIAFEFYNKPDIPFSLKILGKPYRHTLTSARTLQTALKSKGHTLMSNGDGYRIIALNIIFDYARFEGQTVSLVYCEDGYAKLYDKFDYQPVEI